MQHHAFARPGRFFRGNLHTHSTVSDGALEAAEALARRCAEVGAFVALAHPEWNGLTPEDGRLIAAADAV